MADSEKSMADSSVRKNAAVCARQARSTPHAPPASACSPGCNRTHGGNFAIQDAENDRARHLALRGGSK